MSDQWETFCDVGYYHMWRLRRITERGWNDGFHINTRAEAQALCKLLNKLEGGLVQATTNLHEVSCKLAEEATELREHRDRLAEALRDAIKHMRHSLNCPARLPDSGFACACGMEAAYHNASEALAAVEGGSDE